MAKMNVDPVPVPPADAMAALEEDLPKVLKGKTPEEVGWARLDSLTLLVPVVGGGLGEGGDPYFLRLGFGYYRDWPPSAQFVNPETRDYQLGRDNKWLPRIEGWNELHVHANYDGKGQLICCSNTLEFYKVRHSMEPKHLWDPERQNFAATLRAIEWGLQSDYYKGRQG
jgi:hypothetical protein